jgi:predicted AAA+ superfamily ATPase
LTGSSARNLRKQGTNLLAARAWEAHLFPLTWHELTQPDLSHYLRYGGLPNVVLCNESDEALHSYVHTYLKEEIQAESFVRKLVSFSNFLEVAAMTSGQLLNFAKLSSDTGVPASTIKYYYQMLEDTFIGFMVPGWTKTQKRKATVKSKFYFFDLGVKNTLAGITHLDPKSDLFGQAFEHFIALELRAYLSYKRQRKTLCYWRSSQGKEVDFIIADQLAISIKTTNQIQAKHLKNLNLLKEEKLCQRYICVSFDPILRHQDQIELYPWQDFLKELWQDQIIKR